MFCSTAYKNLEDRSNIRQRAWEFPGWDECVVRTGEETISLSPFHHSLSSRVTEKLNIILHLSSPSD